MELQRKEYVLRYLPKMSWESKNVSEKGVPLRQESFWRVCQLLGICIISYVAYLDSFFVTILFFITLLLFVDANIKEDKYDIEHDKREYQDQIIQDLRSRLKTYLRAGGKTK